MADRDEFYVALPSILTDLEQGLTRKRAPKALINRFLTCLQTNVKGGKLNRGIIVLETGHGLLPRPLTAIETRHLIILGWLTEFFQADGVGLSAINDACLIKSSIQVLLRQHFGDHPGYTQLMELFHEASFRTELGQLTEMATGNKCNLAEMTMERYVFLAESKTAFYSFYLPVALGLQYLQRATEQTLATAQEVLFRIGWYFQVQDDYLDVFGDPTLTGKIGTDIRENKCTWIALTAFQLCSSEQKAVLSLCYGRPDMGKEARVKEILCQVDIEGVFRNFETTELDNLEKRIDHIGEEHGPLKNIFRSVLEKISRRDK
ncbi:Farnesyl pyrophosphate synthase [Penicillium alfredii]|uniref:Farnesyl pyrophosphate synthase n=1 Tax=Penicillium alfredii TaxID=1506179 RepID=A0A9W9F0C9_9EURO|nr:Farnesyl pyrophosphate synthase [Penicillium alfredii]KAJ5091282.1 Farnesyl pyrophosphate synthase [Penicillium alfredii]